MTDELPGEYQVGEGRYVIAINKTAAHLIVLILLVVSTVYWMDATGVYPIFGKSPGVE